MRTREKLAIFRLIPPKLAVALLAIAIAYLLLQPLANRALGWHLPSLVSILNLDFRPDQTADRSAGSEEPSTHRSQNKKSSKKVQADAGNTRPTPGTASQITVDIPKSAEPASSKDNSAKQRGESAKKSKTKAEVQSTARDSDLKYDVLKSIGRDRYQSPAGLTYGPGSEEGHRLKHLERHLADDPQRPGSHGVFEGDMTAFLQAIDDAYLRAAKGANGTSKHSEDDVVVYEASFSKPIGYLGGMGGDEKHHPKLKRMRIVVSERNNYVITAFPF
jgi:hypothetical protein